MGAVDAIGMATEDDVAYIYTALANAGDGDGSSISAEDLDAGCAWAMAEGVMTEMDCLAVWVLLEVADATLGNDDGYYTYDEVLGGAAYIQSAVGSLDADEVFGEGDLDDNGAIEYAELEAVMPYLC